MSHCDYDTIFYRVFCATVLGIAFTFTVILTNVFIDIDGLLSKKDTVAESTSNFDSYRTEDVKNDVQYDDRSDDADPYRGKRSIEPDNFLFQVKNPNIKKMLTNKLANLLEELDEEESTKTNGNVEQMKADRESIDNNQRDKNSEQNNDNMLHLAMHNILLQGIIGHMDLNNVYKKVHLLVKNFYEHNTEKPNNAIETVKEIPEYTKQNEEDKFFEELLKCKTLKDQVNGIKNNSQQINKQKDTFVKSDKDGGQMTTNAQKSDKKSSYFTGLPLIQEKQLSDPNWNKIIENYLKQYPVGKDFVKNIENKINRKKRQIKIHYLDSKHATDKPKTAEKIKKDDEELYIEIETHFDGKGIKGEKKKKLVRSLIDKIQKAIHDDGHTATHKKSMSNHIKIMKRNQDPIKMKNDLFLSKIVPAIRNIEHRQLDPISNIISPIDDNFNYNSDRIWNSKVPSQTFYSGQSGKNTYKIQEMGNLLANYNNEISKRNQKPITIEKNRFKNRVNDPSNMTFYLKDIDGSGFSVGFNQYVDEPPDMESLKLFNGVENLIQEYHNTYDNSNKIDKVSDNVSNEKREKYIEREQESISNSHVFRRSVNNEPNLNYSYKKFIKKLIKPLNYYKLWKLNGKSSNKIFTNREYKTSRSPGTINVVSKPIKINDLSVAFINNYYNEIPKKYSPDSLESRLKRRKRSVSVKKVSNLNSKIKLNRFINTNPKFNKKIFKNNKRNKRQVNKIRIIARERSKGKKSKEENVILLSPSDEYSNKKGNIPETDASDTQNSDTVPFSEFLNLNYPNQPLIDEYHYEPQTLSMPQYPHIFFEEQTSREYSREDNSVKPYRIQAKPNVRQLTYQPSEVITERSSAAFSNVKLPGVEEIVNAILPPKSNYKVTVKISPKNTSGIHTGFKEVHTSVNKSYDRNGIRYFSLLNVSQFSKVENVNESNIVPENRRNIPLAPVNNELREKEKQIQTLFQLHKKRIDSQLDNLKKEKSFIENVLQKKEIYEEIKIETNENFKDPNNQINVISKIEKPRTATPKTFCTVTQPLQTKERKHPDDQEKKILISTIQNNEQITKEILKKIDVNTDLLRQFLHKLTSQTMSPTTEHYERIYENNNYYHQTDLRNSSENKPISLPQIPYAEAMFKHKLSTQKPDFQIRKNQSRFFIDDLEDYNSVHLTLLLFELHFIALDCHPKPETNNTETFEIKQLPEEVVQFINTKPDEPVIREIFFYHIIEKPYLKKDPKTGEEVILGKRPLKTCAVRNSKEEAERARKAHPAAHLWMGHGWEPPPNTTTAPRVCTTRLVISRLKDTKAGESVIHASKRRAADVSLQVLEPASPIRKYEGAAKMTLAAARVSPDDQEPDFDESIRPFTNGQGYQYFDSQSKEPTEKDADDKHVKIKRDFSIDTNDTTIPIHVGNTNKNVERRLDKNKKTEDESTKTIENLKYQPVMDNHRNVIYTNSPRNMYAKNEPFKNRVRNMFNHLPSAKQRHTYGMSLHSGFGNIWNNIQSLPFINKIGSLFTPLKNGIEIPINNKKDMEPVVKENPLPTYITNLEIPPAPKILEPTYIKPVTTSRPNTSMEEQFYSSNALRKNKSQDSFKDTSSVPGGFTSEKNEINPGKIYVNENQKTSNDDINELPESNDLTDDTKEAFVNQNNINLRNENKIDEALAGNLQSDVEETEINPVPIKTSPTINDNTKENNEDIASNKHSSFYDKLKKSFKNLLNRLPFKRKPLGENIVKESIGPKKIPTTLNEITPGTYGMSLKNNGGFVWNDLDSKHSTFINVGETPLVDKKDHIPAEPNAESTVGLSHFNDNIVKTTTSTATTNIHTNKQTDSIETSSQIPTNTENTFTTKNVQTTTKIEIEATIGNSHKIIETDSTTSSDIKTPELTNTDTKNQTLVPEILKTTDAVLTTTEVIKTTTKQSTFNKTEITTDNNEITTTEYVDTLTNLTTTVDIKNQTQVSDISSTTDAVLTTTEVIKTTAKQSTFNKTEITKDNNEITTTEHGDTVTNITTIATKEADTNIENSNQDITTQSLSTGITTIGPEVSKNNDIESTTATSLNKTTDKISEPNAKNFTGTSKSNVTTSEILEINNSTTEAQQQSKHFDNIPQKNDTKSHSKGESIKSDLNKLLEKKVFWDWLTGWTSAYFNVLDESIKELVREEVALELKNITELVKNKYNETDVSPTTSIPEINSNETRKSQDDTHDHLTISKPSANISDIESDESINTKNFTGVNIAGDTINGKTIKVTNIFIFMNDNPNNTLKPIVNKSLKYANHTNKRITESTDNVAIIVTTTSRTVLSENDKEKTMSKSNDTSSITNNSYTIKNNTETNLKISTTTTSAASEFTTNEIPAAKNSTNSASTTEKILTTIHQPNLVVTSPSTQKSSSEKTADFVTSENINATTISNNQDIEKISTTLTTIDKTSTINSINSVPEPLITTKSANISTEVTTLTTPLENTTTTTKISPITTESGIGNLNTTKITTQTVSSSTPTSATADFVTSENINATTISNNLATETNSTTLSTIDKTSTINSIKSVTEPLITTKSANISTEVTTLTTPLENTMTTTKISPITTESGIGNLNTTKITTQTVSSNTPTSATEALKDDSTITAATTDSSTTPLNKKANANQTTTPALQNNSYEQNSTTLNNTTSTSSYNTENNSSTEATTTTSSDTKIGVNVTTEVSIANATLMNSTIKEINNDSSTTTVSDKDINLITEATTIKESTNNTETQTTNSEQHSTTEGTPANNSAIKDSLPNITTAMLNSSMNITESSTVENSNSTTTVSGKYINLITEATMIKEYTNNTETQTTNSEQHSTTEGTLANNSAIKDSLPNVTTAMPNSTMNFTESSTVENSNSTEDSKNTQDTKTTTEKATESTTISTTVLDKANKSQNTTRHK
ncbi:unnamed protein product [Pieris macdunnoughi]|uniref:Uncharacterized protein n=1 Tax=Pieris macdunnoughi TaxID=345717 RepID=A0A821UCA0_9NEOP|nr:unnamed protein product [Pieris macdunnoughi]